MKHKHHIIPKHAGGSDDPSNIVELTIEEHAEAHKKLWEQYGKKQDFLAWQGLAKLITKEEILLELCSHHGEDNPMYGLNGENHPAFGTKRTDEQKKKISKSLKAHKRTKEHQSKLNNRFTESYIKSVSNSIARDWIVTTPSGEKITVHNMAEFCREHKLNRGCMTVSSQKGKPHKGYQCEKVGG